MASADNLGIFDQEIITAHAGLTGQAARDHDDIGTGVIGGIIRPLHIAVEVLETRRLQHIERFALRHALHDVVKHDIPEFLLRQTLGRGGPDKTGPDNGDLHK
jgi:hypothetical protein